MQHVNIVTNAKSKKAKVFQVFLDSANRVLVECAQPRVRACQGYLNAAPAQQSKILLLSERSSGAPSIIFAICIWHT